jgi:hypothetical protein
MSPTRPSLLVRKPTLPPRATRTCCRARATKKTSTVQESGNRSPLIEADRKQMRTMRSRRRPRAISGIAVIRARLALRNYGFHCDVIRYSPDSLAGGIPPIENPFATRTRVAFSVHEALMNRTDPYFRGFDDGLPDFFRYIEWAREFDDFVKNKTLPNLALLRLMNDHTGAFAQAIRGVNTPELHVADAFGNGCATAAHLVIVLYAASLPRRSGSVDCRNASASRSSAVYHILAVSTI